MLLALIKFAGLWVAIYFINMTTLCSGISREEFVTLSLDQKELLDQFREKVVSEMPHDYMKRDVYLIRWLRDANFDVSLAERKLIQNLIWREENRMDFITQEDWSDLAKEYKWAIEGCDRDGHVVGSVYFGDWDLRKQVISGNTKRFKRYIDLVGEEASIMGRNMLDQNITQCTAIIEVKNFNLLQHGCANCITLFLHALNTLLERYPGYIHKIVLVNTPQYALTILDILKPYMSKNFKQLMHVYNSDKKVWQKELFREMDQDQLTLNFGGTKKEATDLEDLRRN